MAMSDDLINFDLIETHKENIQSLPGGRSARQLASILSPPLSGKSSTPTLDETKTLNDAIRQEYEIELQSIADSDDPLDIYDRYVKWTLNAYPSAQATPQSQLLPLLERATKSFLTSSHYKNDPRYLKLWLHYIRFFSDAPRETFAFLARHHIGETLALFYEEFAAWLESAGRWSQAEEVYKLGIERQARPSERLLRKYNQFQQRFDARPHNGDEPSSPALPTVRPALAAKMDPFASAVRTEDPQAQSSRPTGAAPTGRSGKPKMAIFSDAESQGTSSAATSTKGWESIGSMRDRKKENTTEAKPWAGETLKAGKKVGTVPKMEIFKDSSSRSNENIQTSSSKNAVSSSKSGKIERVFVDLQSVYPSEHEEFSFEELRAMRRGWFDRDWRTNPPSPTQKSSIQPRSEKKTKKAADPEDVENLTRSFSTRMDITGTTTQPVETTESKPLKPRRKKIKEVKQETQTVKTRLDSPTGKKPKRKGSAEPTMTFHSKAVTNEIYDMFNQPIRKPVREETQSGDDTDHDDTYSIGGDSTGTGRISGANSEYGDETLEAIIGGVRNLDSQDSWSDFTLSKQLPERSKQGRDKRGNKKIISEDTTENSISNENQTQSSGIDLGFDTQAIAGIAGQDFGDMDTQMIARLAGDELVEDETQDHRDDEELQTPVEGPDSEQDERKGTRYLPLPPEDYEPTPIRPYRDSVNAANNKLAFMTPIVERTESSIAPNTIFTKHELFTKTPSRSVDGPKYESPSRSNVDGFLLSSPHKESPSSAKRKLAQAGMKAEEFTSSSPPPKKKTATPSVSEDSGSASTSDDENKPARIGVFLDKPYKTTFKSAELPAKAILKTRSVQSGPIVQDLQLNPCDPTIRTQILTAIEPAISSYPGFFDNSSEKFEHHLQLKSYVDKVAKQKGVAKASPKKPHNEKTMTKAAAPIVRFPSTSRVYAVKKELGKGAFAPVYLVDSFDPESNTENTQISDEDLFQNSRLTLEALKTENPPATLAWEFYILRAIKSRLAPQSRTLQSIILAHECHLFRDEAYLVLDYHSQGTLLNLVNSFRGENASSGKLAEGMDEVLAMWFGIELLRTMEALHTQGIIHGDLKADNCLVRFDLAVEVTDSYHPDGKYGWSSRGFTLIDFGRGIDVRAFKEEAKFVADWPASPQDCVEIRDARPWKWQIDWHGAAGIIHSLLFGKYIETVAATSSRSEIGEIGVTSKKEWKLKEGFKRYWDREIWSVVFSTLLNAPANVGFGDLMALLKELQSLRSTMERWLMQEGEKGGSGPTRDLRASLRKAERLVNSARK